MPSHSHVVYGDAVYPTSSVKYEANKYKESKYNIVVMHGTAWLQVC